MRFICDGSNNLHLYMPNSFCFLFCEDPFEKNKVDPDFEAEYLEAQASGFVTLLVNFESLTSRDLAVTATKRIPQASNRTRLIYRGWMLTPEQYDFLYVDLLAKNYQLINTAEEYKNCHYLPESLKYIEAYTPRTVYGKIVDTTSIDSLLDLSRVFEKRAVVLKDYVKSEKHDWETACFVPDASDQQKLRETINNLIALRGRYLNEGVVIREFIDLKSLTIHSKSGMPLTEEYRLFFMFGKLIGAYAYWEEGEYEGVLPDFSVFEALAKNIESNFFTMDVARKTDGSLLIIELGDGQVSGLPDRLDKKVFYQTLQTLLRGGME